MTNEQYFDGMNLIQSDKDYRVEMCNQLSDMIYGELDRKDSDNWEDNLAKIIIVWLLLFKLLNEKQADVIEEYISYGVRTENSLDNPKWYEREVANNIIADCKNTLKKTISDIQDNIIDTFENKANGVENNSKKSNKTRANVIARNATNRYSNIYNRDVAKNNGYTKHKWLSMRDNRVRDSHRDTDGQVQPIDMPYEVNGYYMMYPMDETYGAPQSEISGCRCTEIFIK